MRFSLPEDLKIVLATGTGNKVAVVAPTNLNNEYICMKGVHKAWCLFVHSGANDTDMVLSLLEATDVAGTDSAAITKTFPIWKDIDAGSASDTLVRQTDAYTLTIDPATQAPVLGIFEWDPAKFSSGFDCVALTNTGGNASNTFVAIWFLDTRYPADQPPTAITD